MSECKSCEKLEALLKAEAGTVLRLQEHIEDLGQQPDPGAEMWNAIFIAVLKESFTLKGEADFDTMIAAVCGTTQKVYTTVRKWRQK